MNTHIHHIYIQYIVKIIKHQPSLLLPLSSAEHCESIWTMLLLNLQLGGLVYIVCHCNHTRSALCMTSSQLWPHELTGISRSHYNPESPHCLCTLSLTTLCITYCRCSCVLSNPLSPDWDPFAQLITSFPETSLPWSLFILSPCFMSFLLEPLFQFDL